MKRTFAPFLAIALASFLPALAMAQDAEPPAFPIPDLMGTWNGTMKEMRWEGGAEGPLELRITAQDGALLRGEKGWSLEAGSSAGSVDGKLVTEAVEPLVGVVEFDGRTIHLAEQNDVGTYVGRLTGPDTLELVYVEAGDVATVYRVILKRTK